MNRRLTSWSGLVVLVAVTAHASEPVSPHRSIRRFEPGAGQAGSAAVSVTNAALVHTAQILPDPASASDGPGAVPAQLSSCVQELKRILQGADTELSSVVKLNIYLAADDVAVIEANLAKLLPAGASPAVSFVRTAPPRAGTRVSLDAVAVTPRQDKTVWRWDRAHTDPSGPGIVGRTAGAILPIGPRVYVSGQAETGDGTVRDATLKTMQGLKRTLEHLGRSWADVVQLKAFLRPMSDAATVVEQMSSEFPGSRPPPIVLVEWDSQTPIEIELIASSPAAPQAPAIEFLTPPWMKASPVFARVVRVSHPTTIFVSGLYGSTTEPDSAGEVRDLFRTLGRVAGGAGSDLRHLVKATYYVSTDEASRHLNEVRPEFYDPGRPPAASKAKVSGTGRPGRSITVDMIVIPARPPAE